MLKWLRIVPKLELNNFRMKMIDCKETFKIKIDILNDKLAIKKTNGQKYMEIKSKL
jgi:hypothetical protein